jgi:CotH kinase protein
VSVPPEEIAEGGGNPSANEIEDCIPLTCAAAAKNCGSVPDGCGGTVACGECGSGQTCGGGGTANVCGVGTCTPVTCADKGKNCGMISDGCSAVLDCGTCTQPEFCGATGVKNVCGQDSLATAPGCGGVFNPDQVLDLHLSMSPSDWTAVVNDATNADYRNATFRCNDDPELPFLVSVRKKRSGAVGGKPGLKIDFNRVLPGSDWQTLKKLSLENGISEGSGSGSAKDLLTEYLAWRLMVRSGAYSSRAAFVRLFVNGTYVGTYVNVEQVDRRFLRSRLGDDTGWLYKHSGSPNDGYKTNSTQPNPYEQYLCFFEKNPNNCTTPSAVEMETYLPRHLNVDQMLRFGGVNAIISNTDSPLVKDNNYYWYDWAAGPRLYFPWDLDTVMRDSLQLFGGSGTTLYTSALFTHWEDDYDVLLTGLLTGPLALGEIHSELDRALTLAGAALSADPTLDGQSPASEVDGLKAWWTTRHAQLTSELQNHAP